MRKKLLFVDDETRVLTGLERLLRRQRDEWDMTFVDGADAALAVLEREPQDVIVTDMRMPRTDGAALLALVRERFPATVRIVLSGHSEVEAALRAVPVAHQFIAKPCDPDVLRAVVRRACALQERLHRPELLAVLGGIDSVPPIPRTYQRLLEALRDPEVRIEDVAAIVEQDQGISAKVLQLVNSSFFGIAREIASVREATTYLGTRTIRDVALAVETFRMSEGVRLPAGFSAEREREHATLCACLARRLVADEGAAEQAFLAGLLHDVGRFLLAAKLTARYEAARAAAREEGVPLHVAEARLHGVTHAEIGAYVLGIWGLPAPVVEAVAHHHDPGVVEGGEAGELSVLGAVHVADALAHEVAAGAGNAPGAGLDTDYLASLGLAGRVEEWRALAARIRAENRAA